MKKYLLGLFTLLALTVFLGHASTARAEELNLDFSLVNDTGYEIKEVYIGPSSEDEWGDNILKKNLKDGQTLEVSFSPKATAKKWDIKCVYEDGETATWKGYKLTEITTFTMHWSKEKGSTAKIE